MEQTTNGITKGKWVISNMNSVNHLVYSLQDDAKTDICCTYAGIIGYEESLANAKAIARLPELIKENEELKLLKSNFDNMLKVAKDKNNFLNGQNERLSSINRELVEVLKNVKECLTSENNKVREYLKSKNDVGQLDMKSDPIQALSFSRGKNAAFCISIEAINKAIAQAETQTNL